MESSWKTALSDEFKKPYFKTLTDFVRQEYLHKQIFPPPQHIFRAFDACPFNSVRVVILGQDPYHGPGQANGMCFSVAENVRIPPSLQNIFKEIVNDLGGSIPASGDLAHWAQQGVLLLNATLTVQAHRAGSHQKKGWGVFTSAVIESLSKQKEGLVFLLWGSSARQKGQVIDRTKHLVLESAHPSPLSAHRGFFGNEHFSKTNDFLLKRLDAPIRWIE
jgi:uracil-DNA glycosylase